MSQSRNLPLVLQAKLYELQPVGNEDTWVEKGTGVPSFVREEVPLRVIFRVYTNLGFITRTRPLPAALRLS